MMCRCPDGSYANMVGNQIVCPSHVQTQAQVGDYWSNGGACGVGYKCSWMPGKCVPEGKVDCGTYACEPGSKCSSAKCIAQEAMDCGGGRYCNAGYFCGFNGRCVTNGNTECGDHSCRPGFTCGSNDACMPNDAVDCGGGKSCAPGQVCVNGGSECLTSAQIADRAARAVQLPNIGNRAPVKTNFDHVVETLRKTDGAGIAGAAALAVVLLLIEAMLRSGKRQRGRQEPNVPALPKGGATLEGPAAPSVAPLRPDVASASAPSSEHPDTGVSQPSSVHDSPWVVHAKGGVKRSPWAAAPRIVSAPPAAPHEPREAPVERLQERAFESPPRPVYREERAAAVDYARRESEPQPVHARSASQPSVPRKKTGVGAGTKTAAIIVNVLVPGFGSFIVGKWGQAIVQLLIGFFGTFYSCPSGSSSASRSVLRFASGRSSRRRPRRHDLWRSRSSINHRRKGSCFEWWWRGSERLAAGVAG